jgi:hypothetical protein
LPAIVQQTLLQAANSATAGSPLFSGDVPPPPNVDVITVVEGVPIRVDPPVVLEPPPIT